MTNYHAPDNHQQDPPAKHGREQAEVKEIVTDTINTHRVRFHEEENGVVTEIAEEMTFIAPEKEHRHLQKPLSYVTQEHMIDHEHHKEQKDKAWKSAWQDTFVQNPQQWLEENAEKLQESFGDFGGKLMCIDEGVEPENGKNAVYIAGSGILYKRDELKGKSMEERADAFTKAIDRSAVRDVTSHQLCGACGMCKEFGEDAEKVAMMWGKAIAKKLGVPYIDHVPPARRPKEFHDALFAYYDGTGRFQDPARAGLPKGFTYSRGILNDGAQGAFEIGVARSIAMGDHGFGKRFTKENPFTIVVIGDPDRPEFSEEKLLQELQPIADQYEMVKIITMKAPSQKVS